MSQITTESGSLSNPKMVNLFESPVLSDWIDYNGHMNDAYYVVAFSKGIDAFMVHIELDDAFRSEYRAAPFLPETLAIVEQMHTAHALLPTPDNAGNGIRLKRKK